MRMGVARSRGGGRQGPRRAAPPRTGLRGNPLRVQRAGLLSSARLAVMRLARGWALLLMVALGIAVAVVLVCTVPLYTTLVGDIQLQRALQQSSIPDRNVQAQIQSDHVAPDILASARPALAALARQYLDGFVAPQPTYYVISDPMLLLQVGKQVFDPTDPRARQVTFDAFDYSSAGAHLRLLSGGLPHSGGSHPQVLILQPMADAFHLTIGSLFIVTEFGDHSKKVMAQVAGIWEPTSATDPYWNGLSFNPAASTQVVYPLLSTTDDFFAQLAQFSNVGMRQNWIFYTQADRLDQSSIGAVADGIGGFRSRLTTDILGISGVGSVRLLTGLDQTIGDVQNQQALLALPLYIIVAQIVGLALLFVTAMSGLLIESQSGDIATLKSRGASGTQMLTTFTAQGVILSLLAMLAGPFIAAALSLALLQWFIPAQARGASSSSYLAQLANPATVAAPALFGALLGIGVICLTAWQSARRDVLAFRREQGRATRIPFWRRYYLDLALVVLCFFGYVELGHFGDVSTRQQLGVSSSPLLLAAPALLLLAGALVVLRVFPLGAAFGARIAARGKGVTALLSLSQVERNPGRYTRLTLLLVLAVGLGLFALTFDASLTQNASDRAAYTVGADVRLSEHAGLGKGQDVAVVHRLASLPGVAAVAPVYRSTASASQDEGGGPVDVLAVDPATLGQVVGPVAWRNDYATQSLTALLNGMRQHVRGATAGSSDAPIWAVVSASFAAKYHLNVGDQFSLQFDEAATGSGAFVVGAEVAEFPTLYPTHATGGFILTDSADYFAAIVNAENNANAGATFQTGPATAPTPPDTSRLGANEFWLRATGDSRQEDALLRALNQPDPNLASVVTLRQARADADANPISAGMRGLLLVGAVTAALLAILGSVVQSLLASRQRATQFAVLRTVGMSARQLAGLLLGEQVIVYLFGLIGGTLLGLLLVTATLPFLQFSDTTVDPSKLGIPPYQLAANPATILVFYAALLGAFLLALLVAARYAATIGIGKALRIGED